MKCPKCSFISFDFNPSCPKCKKDLSEVRTKMNLPSFRPSTLDLLGLAGQSEGRMHGNQAARLDAEETMEIKYSDKAVSKPGHDSAPTERIDEAEIDFSLEDDSDSITLEFDEPSTIVSSPAAAQNKDISATEASIAAGLDLAFEDEADELSLDMDELSFDDIETKLPEVEAETTLGKSAEENLEHSFDDDSLGDNDLNLKDSEIKQPQIETEFTVDSAEKDLDLSFENLEDDMNLGSDDFLIDSSEDETINMEEADGGIDLEFDFTDSDQEKTVAFDAVKEDPSSLDLESTSIEEFNADIDLKFTEQEGQLVFDAEESAPNVKDEKNQDAVPPPISTGQDNGFSTELDVMDLDLDLDKLDK